ncbi:polyphosphate polymerase domain-containing protein [Candidatus Gracilibacteria bacterium]|nr:polyphosphate polymerase domain-containing protein [Candidatus Gracilibacteria bacterium]
MGSALLNRLSGFSAMSLTELNATASYLKRIDRKFLMTEEKFLEILGDLSNDFKALEIGDKRVFLYDNVYMDTDDYLFYNQHQNRVPSRTKVRTRHYTDAGDLAFFEYKQKEDGVTKKFRYQFPASEHGTMTKGKKRFFEGVFQSLYSDKAPEISPAMRTKYNRLTLVSVTGEERLTIDFNISVKDLRNEKAKNIKLDNLVIIESKSLSDNCKSLDIIKGYGVKQAGSCSKYSLGVIYSGLAEKWTKFEKTMKKIKKIRMELVKQKRNSHAKSVERQLSHHFKKTSLKKVSKTV